MRSAHAILALLILALASVAVADNVVMNPDFETGDLTGWQVFGGSPGAFVAVQGPDNGPSHPGSNHAYMENDTGAAIALLLKQTTPVGTGIAGETNYSFD